MKNVEKDKTKKEIIANNGIIYKIKKNIKSLHLKQFLNNYTQFQKEKEKENNYKNKEIIKYLDRKKPPKV